MNGGEGLDADAMAELLARLRQDADRVGEAIRRAKAEVEAIGVKLGALKRDGEGLARGPRPGAVGEGESVGGLGPIADRVAAPRVAAGPYP